MAGVTTRAPLKSTFNIVKQATDPNREPVETEILWEDDQKEIRKETFLAKPWEIPDIVVFEIGAIEELDSMAPVFKIYRFAFGAVTKPDSPIDPVTGKPMTEYKRFMQFCERTDVKVQAQHLVDIMYDLIGKAAAVPTEASDS